MFAHNFRGDLRGNVSMLFALSVVPLFAAVGAAVDYSRLADTREKMQSSLDAMVLTLSAEVTGKSAAEINARATQIFNANFAVKGVTDVNVTTDYVRNGGATLTATATGSVGLSVLSIAGVSSSTVSATSQANWSSTRLRVALALDNTGSMNDNGKLTALKTATHGLLDKLKSASSRPGDLYVSIIPFSRDVNIDPANYTKTWLDWSLWSADSANQTKTCSGWGWYQNCTTTVNDKSTWTGCVTDRNKDYDISAAEPSTAAAYFFPDQYSKYCPKPLTALTNDFTVLGKAVDAMVAAGATNQAIGLAWAWQTLSLGGPLYAPAKETGYDYQDVIVLLSDGMNTQNRWGGDGANNWPDADLRMNAVCTAAKTAGVTIYTVLVIDGSEQVLKSCASSADKYFNADSASEIITSFGVIGDKLTALRISH
jgi:Flp pilus assembly protein TadG